jgi:hypothetical protein
MTVGIAAAVANADLNRFRNTAGAALGATIYVQLHTADPGAAGTTGVSAGSTTRNAITWNAASAGSMTLATLSAWTNGGTSETISHVSLWDASTSGTFLHSFALSASQAWVSTNTLTLTTFTLSRTPIAA